MPYFNNQRSRRALSSSLDIYLPSGFGGLGDNSDPAFAAGQQALERARQAIGPPSGEGDYFNQYWNLSNSLDAWARGDKPDHNWTEDVQGYAAALNAYLDRLSSPGQPVTPDAPPIERDPGSAAFVAGLYRHYFGREPDSGGWNFWTLELIKQRKTRTEVENAFANNAEAKAFSEAQAKAIPVAPGVTITPGTPTPPMAAPAPVTTTPAAAAQAVVAAATGKGLASYLTKRNVIIGASILGGGFLLYEGSK